jgi:hypothetical protein
MIASASSANFCLTCRSARFGPSTEIRKRASALHSVEHRYQALSRRRRKLPDKLFATWPEHCKSIIRISECTSDASDIRACAGSVA